MYIRNHASGPKGLDLARPPNSWFILGGEENAAAPHFPPLPNFKR